MDKKTFGMNIVIGDILFNLENMGYLNVMTSRLDSTSKCYQIN